MTKQRNVRRRRAQRYFYNAAKLEEALLPRELRKASIEAKYEWMWENYYRHDRGPYGLPWSVVYTLQRRPSKTRARRIREWKAESDQAT